jgi:adenylate kinase
MKLKKFFPFHLINAVGSIEDVMHAIWKEFEYQSSYELDQRTFDTIQHIPIASKVGISARQDLARRLEGYTTEILAKSVSLIDSVFMPTIQRHAISGMATVRM